MPLYHIDFGHIAMCCDHGVAPYQGLGGRRLLDDGAAVTPRRSRPGGLGAGPGAGAGAGAGAAAAARSSRRALRLASCLASPLSSAAASILSISRSARSPFSTQGVHDQFPGFFRWFFEYSSRGSQVPHCAQCFPLVARSAAVTAADILSAAWASRSSRSGARGGGSRRIANDFDRTGV